jgi:crotonobetainyl-CoA:carnitine CoA-transferase CaiB-like acyl-CoA transferase
VVETTQDLFEDSQLKHREHIRWLDHPVMGKHIHRRPAFKLSKTPDQSTAAPTLGQHNEYVYKELLGLSDEEIADLLAERVITTEADLPW